MAFWDKITSRGDVEDRRSLGASALGGVGIGGIGLYLLINTLLGQPIDLGQVLQQMAQVSVTQPGSFDTQQFEGEDSYEVFASTVLGSANDTWAALLSKEARTYEPPTLVLFRNATESSCGLATSQVGPHYCPLDSTIYLDETFFDELQYSLGATGGDVAEAYVIAHEVGHHVQNQLGTLDTINSAASRNPASSNQLFVQFELQADCFAGVWAHSIRDLNVLSPGEIGEAMDTAAAIGDDRIQEKATGHIEPESWTHGSSAQRVEWFTRGYEQGTVEACDTFSQ